MTNRERILAYIRENSPPNYPVDAVTICRDLGIKRPLRIFAELEQDGLIVWDWTYRGWKIK